MTIEEKAERYDEAIETAKLILDMTSDKSAIYTIFPELEEKSEDERIRKWLFHYFTEVCDNVSEKEKKGVLDWIEKQGEHANFLSKIQVGDKVTRNEGGVLVNISQLERVAKPRRGKLADKVELEYEPKYEPKFHEGEWINGYYTNYKVLSVNNEGYVVEDTDGNKINILFENEKFHHPWSIKDAKDGDVLATSAGAFIYNGNNGGGSCPGSYCGINTLGRFKTGVEHHWTGLPVSPATKEQRDLLFQKMKEVGYEWDAEKKELKKIEQKPTEWSKEDDINLGKAIWYVENHAPMVIEDSLVEWLKSLKGRVQSQSKKEWSEEDDYNLQCMIAKVVSDIQKGNVGRNQELIDWLKSLKSQKQWKPSEEQMKALNNVILKGELSYVNQGKELISLYKDLKQF